MRTPTATPTLADLFDADLLTAMIDGGYVRVQRHPGLPLVIYNYTERAQYDQVWNPVTLACRGLICDAGTGAVVARPFPKFFNHDQPQAPTVDPTQAVTVTDKVDGSLGILHPTPDGWAVATRGSFDSDQARHATAVLRSRYGRFAPPDGLTVLVEILYPANRIVIDYAGLDDLVLLGAVETATGRTHGPDAVAGWSGPVAETFGYATFAEALAAPPRAGREGLVVHVPETDTRVKLKYPEYLRLHRLVTGLTTRTVWECLVAGGPAAGDPLGALLAPLPDEFHPWVARVAAELTAAVEARAAAVEAGYAAVVADLPAGFTRKEFAARVAGEPDRGLLFLRLDGHDYRPRLWQRVRPESVPLHGGGDGEG